MTQQSAFDRRQQAYDANIERQNDRCSHDVYAVTETAGIDAARPTVIVECGACGELGDAALTVDWS